MRRPLVPCALLGIIVLCVVLGACGSDDQADDAAPTIGSPAPSLTPPATAPPGATRPTSPIPCDAATLLPIMQSQGGRFELAPELLAQLRPIGAPKCDARSAVLAFAGPAENPGPFDALFGITPGRTWELASVDCRTSVADGSKQIC